MGAPTPLGLNPTLGKTMYRTEDDDPMIKDADMQEQRKAPTQMSEPSENYGQTSDRNTNN